MSHYDLWGWADLEGLAARVSRRIKSALIRAHEQYERWLDFKAGRTDAQIATAHQSAGWKEADVAIARLALEKVDELYTFADNGASPTQGDRITDMRECVMEFSGNPLIAQVKGDVRELLDAMVDGDEAFAEYNSLENFLNPSTTAQVATHLQTPATEARVDDAKFAIRSANQIHDFANNQSVFGGQRDRFEDWRRLS